MTCNNCNAELDTNANFCGECGNVVSLEIKESDFPAIDEYCTEYISYLKDEYLNEHEIKELKFIASDLNLNPQITSHINNYLSLESKTEQVPLEVQINIIPIINVKKGDGCNIHLKCINMDRRAVSELIFTLSINDKDNYELAHNDSLLSGENCEVSQIITMDTSGYYKLKINVSAHSRQMMKINLDADVFDFCIVSNENNAPTSVIIQGRVVDVSDANFAGEGDKSSISKDAVWEKLNLVTNRTNVEAEYKIGQLFHEMKNVKALAYAKKWMEIAERHNHAEAIKALTIIKYEQDAQGTENKNSRDSINKLKEAAKTGHNKAVLEYSNLLWSECSRENNDKSASKQKECFEYLNKLMNDNNPDVLFKLGESCRKGIGTETDLAKAVKYYKKAATTGNTDALASLIELYKVNPNLETVAGEYKKILQLSVEKGSKNARNILAEYILEHGADEELTQEIEFIWEVIGDCNSPDNITDKLYSRLEKNNCELSEKGTSIYHSLIARQLDKYSKDINQTNLDEVIKTVKLANTLLIDVPEKLFDLLLVKHFENEDSTEEETDILIQEIINKNQHSILQNLFIIQNKDYMLPKVQGEILDRAYDDFVKQCISDIDQSIFNEQILALIRTTFIDALIDSKYLSKKDNRKQTYKGKTYFTYTTNEKNELFNRLYKSSVVIASEQWHIIARLISDEYQKLVECFNNDCKDISQIPESKILKRDPFYNITLYNYHRNHSKEDDKLSIAGKIKDKQLWGYLGENGYPAAGIKRIEELSGGEIDFSDEKEKAGLHTLEESVNYHKKEAKVRIRFGLIGAIIFFAFGVGSQIGIPLETTTQATRFGGMFGAIFFNAIAIFIFINWYLLEGLIYLKLFWKKRNELTSINSKQPEENHSNKIISDENNLKKNATLGYLKTALLWIMLISTIYLVDRIFVLGNAQIQFAFGLEYYSEDKAEALKLFRKAAEQGHPDAQNMLGVRYAIGEGVTEDKAEAVKWYQKAAEQGNAQAQYNLGNSFFYGKGVTKGKAEATKWYRKAAEKGHAKAQNMLGVRYALGEGVTEDKAEAVKWYRKAAEQGNVDAQYNLANAYRNGEGVKKDITEAVKWYRKAAEQGHEKSQKKLGSIL